MGNYFIEQHWSARLKYYLAQTQDWRESEKGLFEAEKISQASLKIVRAILFTHKFMRFGTPGEDLVAEAMDNVWKALPKFDPEFVNKKGKKTTLFNYISLTAKRSMMFQTIRDKKWRDLSYNGDFDDLREVRKEDKKHLYNIPIDDEKGKEKFKEILYKKIEVHWTKNKSDKMKKSYEVLMRILPEVLSVKTKTTLMKAIKKEYDVKTVYIRDLFKEIEALWPKYGYLNEPIEVI